MQMVARGVVSFGGVIARTYGPVAGRILVSRGRGVPEVLDDSGVLARRIVGLDERREHAGAMAVREMCLAMRERYGDGAACAAVLATALVKSATRRAAAGGNPMAIRDGIERGVAAACAALDSAAQPVGGADDLARLATGVVHDRELAAMLGELYDILGPDAGLIIEETTVPGVDRFYVDGARWRARPAYSEAFADGATELTLRNPLVVVADATLSHPADVVAMLDAAATERRPLLLIARGVEADARVCLQRNRHRVVVTAMCLASGASALDSDLEDVALMTGATLLADARGTSPRSFRPLHAGSATQVLAHKRRLVVHGWPADRQDVERRADEVRASLSGATRGSDRWRKLRLRLARLCGAMGGIVVGGHTETERKHQIEHVRKAQRVLEQALSVGVVAGGGVALLECARGVDEARGRCTTVDEAWGVDAVLEALPAPFMQIVANSAVRHDRPHPDVALHRVRELGSGWGFDARDGSYVQMAKACVLDCAGVLQGALQAAGSLAGTVVTTAGVVRARSDAA